MHVCTNAVGVRSGAPAAGNSMWRVDLPGAKAMLLCTAKEHVDTRQAEAHKREVQSCQQQQPQMSIINGAPCQGPANLQCIRRRNIRLYKCQHQASAKLFNEIILLILSSSDYTRPFRKIRVGYPTLRHTGRSHVRRRLVQRAWPLSRMPAGKAHRTKVLVLVFSF